MGNLPRSLWYGAATVAVLGLVGGAGWWLRGIEARKQAAADAATIAAHQLTIARLQAAEAHIDTVYARDTVRLTRTVATWDTLTIAQRFTDTVVHRDTVLKIIAAGNAVVEACQLALATCEERQAVLRARVVAESTAVRGLSRELARAKVRSRLACAVGPTYSLNGPAYAGVSCGVRIF